MFPTKQQRVVCVLYNVKLSNLTMIWHYYIRCLDAMQCYNGKKGIATAQQQRNKKGSNVLTTLLIISIAATRLVSLQLCIRLPGIYLMVKNTSTQLANLDSLSCSTSSVKTAHRVSKILLYIRSPFFLCLFFSLTQEVIESLLFLSELSTMKLGKCTFTFYYFLT